MVYNANELAKLVEEKKKMQNWLDYYQLKYTRNKEQRPRVKVNILTNPKSRNYILSAKLLSDFAVGISWAMGKESRCNGSLYS